MREEAQLILVLMGGESAEHDVSLRSGAAVVKHLPLAGYRPFPVVVTRDGRYAFPKPHDLSSFERVVDLDEAIAIIRSSGPACAFIAMHGPYGEDGRIQALCDLLHLPYVGSDVTGSALAMDKWLAKCVYRCHGIPTPKATLVDRSRFFHDERAECERIRGEIGLPCVVKTTRLGSSVGVSIARDLEGLASSIRSSFEFGSVMCEEYHPGRELTVPVLEDPEPKALPVIEIVVHDKERFFDYQVKYDPALADEVCPANIPKGLAEEVQRLAVMAHKALMLSGFSRTDFMVDSKGIWALETNTIPGLTEVSLFPKAAKAAGLSFAELLDILIKNALSRAKRA